jgi:hypothetical protein
MPEIDLNNERALETGPWHTLRDVIANALDERPLPEHQSRRSSRGADGSWHVRDQSRGLRYEYLTQSENREKLAHPDTLYGASDSSRRSFTSWPVSLSQRVSSVPVGASS